MNQLKLQEKMVHELINARFKELTDINNEFQACINKVITDGGLSDDEIKTYSFNTTHHYIAARAIEKEVLGLFSNRLDLERLIEFLEEKLGIYNTKINKLKQAGEGNMSLDAELDISNYAILSVRTSQLLDEIRHIRTQVG